MNRLIALIAGLALALATVAAVQAHDNGCEWQNCATPTPTATDTVPPTEEPTPTPMATAPPTEEPTPTPTPEVTPTPAQPTPRPTPHVTPPPTSTDAPASGGSATGMLVLILGGLALVALITLPRRKPR